MFDTAVEWDYLRVSPFYQRTKVSLPKLSHEQKGRGLTPEEVKKLLDAAYDLGYTMIATAVFTGMRLSELLALRWEDVDLDKNQVHVRRSLARRRKKFGGTGFEFVVPKSEKSIRRIDLSPRLKKILLEHKLSSGAKPGGLGLVFCNSVGNPVDRARFMKDFFYPTWGAAGIGYLRFHDLRHTYGSLKIHQGENLKYVQLQMGHASIKVTLDVYGHLLQDTNPQAAAKTDELVFGASC
jgi:integrase